MCKHGFAHLIYLYTFYLKARRLWRAFPTKVFHHLSRPHSSCGAVVRSHHTMLQARGWTTHYISVVLLLSKIGCCSIVIPNTCGPDLNSARVYPGAKSSQSDLRSNLGFRHCETFAFALATSSRGNLGSCWTNSRIPGPGSKETKKAFQLSRSVESKVWGGSEHSGIILTFGKE